MRRIVFIHDSLGLGGAEVLRVSVLQEMKRRGHQVEVVVTRREGELANRVRELEVPVVCLENRGTLLDFTGIYKLAKYLGTTNPDIVQSSLFLSNLHARIACRLAGVKNHVIEEHGIYTWKKRRHLWLDRRFNAKATAVIACSNQVAASAANQLNVPVGSIDVIHNCVSREHLEPLPDGWLESQERATLRHSLVGENCRMPRHISVIVGTLRWEKGHSLLLDAWRRLTKQQVLSEDHHLLIVGDGPLREKLQDEASSLANVHLLGSIRDTRLILSASDLFILPSVNEGFGIAIIEAMAAGLPVIASNSGGIPEVICDQSGVLVEAGDVQALENAMARTIGRDTAAMSAAARTRVESHFTPEVYVDQLESLYDRLLPSCGMVAPD